MSWSELGFGMLVLAAIGFVVALPTGIIRWFRAGREHQPVEIKLEPIRFKETPAPEVVVAVPSPPVHETLATAADAIARAARQERISKREMILREIRQSPEGLTTDEVQTILDLSHQTASARVHELERDGYIVPSGKRRLTRQGKTAHVWVVAGAKSSEAA